MNPIRLAAVGTGYFSQFQYEAWSRIGEVELVAVCNRSLEGAQSVADTYGVASCYTDFDQMLTETTPDIVDVITPPATHLEFIRIAANRGVNVICQKPFCRSLEEAREAVNVAETAGIFLVIHENVRFQPWYAEMRRQTDDGRLGEVYQGSFRLRPGDGQGNEAYLNRQPYFQQMDRFLIHETGVHWIDTFRYLFGEVASVFAQLRRLNPVIAGEDSGLVIFNFTSGVQAVFDGNRLADHKADNRRLTMGEMTIEGARGVLSLSGDGDIAFRQNGDNCTQAIDYPWQNINFGGDCVYLLQRHVVDSWLAGKAFANTGRDYLKNLEIERAIYQSADQGCVIAVHHEDNC